jgi:hypothetical protein
VNNHNETAKNVKNEIKCLAQANHLLPANANARQSGYKDTSKKGGYTSGSGFPIETTIFMTLAFASEEREPALLVAAAAMLGRCGSISSKYCR